MTKGQMYEKIESYVNRIYPYSTAFNYDVIHEFYDVFYVEISVCCEDVFGNESLIQIFADVSKDRRRAIVVTETCEYKF